MTSRPSIAAFGAHLRSRVGSIAADTILDGWERITALATIGPGSRRAARFAHFGPGAAICFPPTALFGEQAIHIGAGTLIGPHCSLSAGMVPNQSLISDQIVVIGERCLIGRQSSIVGHLSIVIGDDVYFGPNVYVTDQNHGYADPALPIGRQTNPERPVRIGSGSWIGTNAVVLPGVTIGRQVVIGAGSIVHDDIPDHSIAVGVPARVLATNRPEPIP